VQKVVALASRQTNQKQVHHFVCSARHFPGCAGVRFSRGQEPQTYSSSAKRTFASAVTSGSGWRPPARGCAESQNQVYYFVYRARCFLGCDGVRFSRGQEPHTYSSSAKRIFASAAEWRPGVPAEIPVPASADSGSRLVAMDDASSLSGVADFGVRFQW